MILAIDPGLATCGWALVAAHTGRVHDLGVLITKSNSKLGKGIDRVARLEWQTQKLYDLVNGDWGVRSIAAEAMSFPRGRTAAIVSLCLSWGAIVGLAMSRSLPIRQIQPKRWRSAVVPGSVGETGYDAVFAALSEFVDEQAAESLAKIKPGDRTHALDAVGVGVYAALTPEIVARETKQRRRA